jgi:hypothetical protein
MDTKTPADPCLDTVDFQLSREAPQRYLNFCSLSDPHTHDGIGIGSDVVVKKLHMSRFWCVIISSLVFCAAQVAGATVENQNSLVFVSGLTGRESSHLCQANF